ncbi:MAG: aspartyl/glutamyl-tRNA amidotransferase subunit C, partial [Planctomycetes bacterium]|nr:aspartyl/glutamyl-tRNA amidotransferase subunit C [Planctomycetota bacterium]
MERFGPYASACNAFEVVEFERQFETSHSACRANTSRHSETVLPPVRTSLKSMPRSALTKECQSRGTVNRGCRMTLSIDDVRRVANLARLSFTEEELAEITLQLGKVVDLVAQLSVADTQGIEPMVHAIE